MPYTSTLIVEDGTIVANANSYVDKAFALSYFTLYGNTDWSGEDADLDIALLQATQSLDNLYGDKYASYRLESQIQYLLWPRYAFYDQNGNLRAQAVIPRELKQAICEIALLFLTGKTDGAPLENERRFLSSESQKVGEIAVSYTYKKPIETDTFDGYRKIDLLLRNILKPKITTLRIHR